MTRTKACAYLRTNRQDASISITMQRQRLLEFAKSNEYEIIHWYADEGYSGTNMARPDWRKLLADAPTAEWGVVLCLDRARINRFDSIDGAVAMQTLRKAGKKVHTAQEGLLEWHAPVYSNIKTVQRLFNEFASNDVSLGELAARLNAKGIPAPREEGGTHGEGSTGQGVVD